MKSQLQEQEIGTEDIHVNSEYPDGFLPKLEEDDSE